MAISLKPIGVVHSPHKTRAATPIQPRFASDFEGTVEVFEPFVHALSDLDAFERIWIIFALDRAGPFKPKVIPFRDTIERGLFSTRAPCRPNPLGMSVVRLFSVEHNLLRVGDLDILDGTPLLDIKPYVPLFDSYPDARAGWIGASDVARTRSDERFGN
ncbi:MAG: tRNA (N6-threonylcarbamoyladenosine(37)-N6)-methyltransferase TrmO [Proteobacteria bacterium]|jgi:tRNA (adenine37-N6)-methyltransferase|nr:tRNA (N6-threonylcarbamoyladenosine(37)-N6)-methyltransferase TrmO [Pseudomonadota bacterium]